MNDAGELEQSASQAGTLGEVLYASPTGRRVTERQWAELVRDIAAGRVEALHRLYERAGRLVFVLVFRIVGERRFAEDITLDVFEDVWRRAWSYDSGPTVLAWVMNQARSRAREHARLAGRAPAAALTVPLDELQPDPSLAERLARRIAQRTTKDATPPPPAEWHEPEWDKVAPGIEVKLLANDDDRDRVSMMVRLEPGGRYPPHTHAGVEELHLLEGELWIDDRKLVPGDYNRAEAPTGDNFVGSDTGCACVLITSTRDRLKS